jgi:hypothetical protein
VVFRFDVLLCALLLFLPDAFAFVLDAFAVPLVLLLADREALEGFVEAAEFVFVPEADAPEVLRR